MQWLLVLLFVVIPLLEVYLLGVLASAIHFWPTVALVLVTGVAGGWLAKREGLRVYREWRDALTRMTPPPRGVIDGVLVLVGAVLLISPGVLTDVLGLALLVPWTRRLVGASVRAAVERRIARVVSRAHSEGSPRVVATEGVGVDGQPSRPAGEL